MDFIPDDLYMQILDKMPIACVDIAIVARGSVLLVIRADQPARGQWWVPGGRVRKGETMRQAAQRKAVEEVGIECHVGPILHTAETIFEDGPRGIPVHSINSCFLCYPCSDDWDVVLDGHHEEYRWTDTISNDLHPYVQACLAAAGLEQRTDTFRQATYERVAQK